MNDRHRNTHTGRNWRIAALGLSPVVFLGLAGCSPPDQKAIAECRVSAEARGQGRHLDAGDRGELVEWCMSWKGYALKKNSEGCQHDQSGEQNRMCYFPNSWLGRLVNG